MRPRGGPKRFEDAGCAGREERRGAENEQESLNREKGDEHGERDGDSNRKRGTDGGGGRRTAG